MLYLYENSYFVHKQRLSLYSHAYVVVCLSSTTYMPPSYLHLDSNFIKNCNWGDNSWVKTSFTWVRG